MLEGRGVVECAVRAAFVARRVQKGEYVKMSVRSGSVHGADDAAFVSILLLRSGLVQEPRAVSQGEALEVGSEHAIDAIDAILEAQDDRRQRRRPVDTVGVRLIVTWLDMFNAFF
ncbi:hypothetical protein SPRG_13779 [Saprolegnia parasitica CBS 223.65]|uniref:Uncharacterized protein n=1 Tax=Saprolegnia parasitica (strain CBS 223.65) TaxID=695850 RepID=A0A067C0Q2_SAPPC|nr:hypothetical protein SPRG_13779 [Saprolegnia parasitica CBS 223.65]KDO20397.1 hypothetical protein SPRG_13779 [Saprolegnia parasitica CBS 223.65]|eukprot:XP_012208922.1 hypothetical protein SPRG_13779 [Saprolegnia parasitica CBS 223.65]